MDSRTTVGAVVVVLVLTSGCLSIITGETLTYEASPVEVSDSALEETGYELAEQRRQNATRTYSVAGQERTVKVSNHLSRYERTVSLGQLGETELARFVVLSTPAVEIAGRTFNPVGDWSERRIVRELSAGYSGLSDVSHVGNRTVQILGEDRTVATFSGRATAMGDREVDVRLHVTKFRHGDDFVVAIGIRPERLPGEGNRIDGMLQGIEH